MDLAKLDISKYADQGAWLQLKHPSSGEDLPVRIKLAGQDSATWRAGERKFADERLAHIQKAGKMGRVTTAQAEERGLKLLASVTLEWEGVVVNGAPIPCTRERAEQLYRDFVWIREQVDEFVADRSNFLPADALSTQAPSGEGLPDKSSLFSGEEHLGAVAGN